MRGALINISQCYYDTVKWATGKIAQVEVGQVGRDRAIKGHAKAFRFYPQCKGKSEEGQVRRPTCIPKQSY